MDKELLDYFKDELLNKKQELMQGASRTISSGLKVDQEELSDTMDRSSIETDRNFVLRLRDRERKLIKKIDEALAKIDDGSFGICEECGEEIGEERLKVRPVATLCITCKEEEERREKMKR